MPLRRRSRRRTLAPVAVFVLIASIACVALIASINRSRSASTSQFSSVCGDWQRSYAQLHRETLAGSRPKRLCIATTRDEQGLYDRLTGDAPHPQQLTCLTVGALTRLSSTIIVRMLKLLTWCYAFASAARVGSCCAYQCLTPAPPRCAGYVTIFLIALVTDRAFLLHQPPDVRARWETIYEPHHVAWQAEQHLDYEAERQRDDSFLLDLWCGTAPHVVAVPAQARVCGVHTPCYLRRAWFPDTR